VYARDQRSPLEQAALELTVALELRQRLVERREEQAAQRVRAPFKMAVLSTGLLTNWGT
jgi:hypothetical protein